MCCHLGVRGSLSTQGGGGEGVPGGLSAGLPSRVGPRRWPRDTDRHRGVSRQLAAGRPSPAGPSSVCFALQQYGSFQMDKLECSQLGSWRASPPAHGLAPPEQQLHSEGGDLLYAPSYGLPFSYHYGPFPLDSHVFSSKKPVLPAKFGQPQGPPCEVARFLLSALPAGSECQWRYASPLVPGSPSPAKSLSEPPVNPARHSLMPNYEGGSCLHEGRGQDGGWRWRWVADGERMPRLWANTPCLLPLSGSGRAFPPSLRALPEAGTAPVCLVGTRDGGDGVLGHPP